jgi:hypothetical protein
MTPSAATAPADDDVRAWKPTRAEWDSFIAAELTKLGISREELERQARERDFQSTEALSLWMMIG